jgi:hypothetical protein
VGECPVQFIRHICNGNRFDKPSNCHLLVQWMNSIELNRSAREAGNTTSFWRQYSMSTLGISCLVALTPKGEPLRN